MVGYARNPLYAPPSSCKSNRDQYNRNHREIRFHLVFDFVNGDLSISLLKLRRLSAAQSVATNLLHYLALHSRQPSPLREGNLVH